MICVRGLDCKTYWDRLAPGRPLPEIPCPQPKCEGELLRGHGWYTRYLDEERVAIRRVICHRCRVSHAVLPEDVCAYHDLTLWALEQALETPGGPSAVARATGQVGEAGRRRARRWQRRADAPWSAQLLALLPPMAGHWWERVQATVGAAPGALVRLRRWLWSTWRCFFSGLNGLFRRGRPRVVVRGDSTDLGILFSEMGVS